MSQIQNVGREALNGQEIQLQEPAQRNVAVRNAGPNGITDTNALLEAYRAKIDSAQKYVHIATWKKVLVGIFTLGTGLFITSAIEDCRAAKTAEMRLGMAKLRNALADCTKPGISTTRKLKLAGSTVQVFQDPRMGFDVSFEGNLIKCPNTPQELLDAFDREFASHPEVYGALAEKALTQAKAGADVAMRSRNADVAEAAEGRLRAICNDILHTKLGIDPAQTERVNISILYNQAVSAQKGQIADADKLLDFFSSLNVQKINDQATIDLMAAFEAQMKTEAGRAAFEGNVKLGENVSLADSGPSQPNEQQAAVHNFAADLIFSENTWEHDSSSVAERVRATFVRHADTLAKILADPKLLDSLDKESTSMVQAALAELGNAVKLPENATGEQIRAAFKALDVEDVQTAARLAKIDDVIGAQAKKASREMGHAVYDMFTNMCLKKADPAPQKPVQEEQEKPQEQPKIVGMSEKEEFDLLDDGEGSRLQMQFNTMQIPGDEESSEDIIDTSSKPVKEQKAEEKKDARPVQGGKIPEKAPDLLDAMLKKGPTDLSKPGMAMFMQKVLQRYFTEMTPLDQRSMLACMTRYSNASSGTGRRLGALLKGAGPILQKMMQVFEGSDLDPEFRAMIGDLKSKLAPIPENIIRAKLNKLVTDSNGVIKSITVKKSLGAATVGQALHCEIETAEGKKDCVIKLLRSDVRVRAKTEEALFANAAKEVPGMESTYKMHMESIMQELDLTVEAKNITDGQVYGNGHNTSVHSVGLNPLVPPTADCIVLDFVKGMTMDSYLGAARKRLEELIAPYRTTDKNGKVTYHKPPTWEEFRVLQNNLSKLYREVSDRQHLLCNLTEKWIQEAIYSETGFAHCDLHPGNIMVDDEGKNITLIDFGNATSFDLKQQSSVMLMFAGATTQTTGYFMQGFRELLEQEKNDAALKMLDERKAEVSDAVDGILKLGNQADAGKRVLVALNTLQGMGISIPSPLFRFTNGENRLQGSFSTLNGMMAEIKKCLTDVNDSFQGKDLNPGDFFTLDYMYEHCGNYKNFRACIQSGFNQFADEEAPEGVVPDANNFRTWIQDETHRDMVLKRLDAFYKFDPNTHPEEGVDKANDSAYREASLVYRRMRPYIVAAGSQDKPMPAPGADPDFDIDLMIFTMALTEEVSRVDFEPAFKHWNNIIEDFEVPADFTSIMANTIEGAGYGANWDRLGMKMFAIGAKLNA